MQIKRVSIIGLGALGILFGNHLAKRMPHGKLRIIAEVFNAFKKLSAPF